MKRKLSIPPDMFAVSPMLALLPVLGQVGELDQLTTFFYARYEKVKTLIDNTGDNPNQRPLVAELAMLKQVLEWLNVKPNVDNK